MHKIPDLHNEYLLKNKDRGKDRGKERDKDRGKDREKDRKRGIQCAGIPPSAASLVLKPRTTRSAECVRVSESL